MPFQVELEDDEGRVKVPTEYLTNLKLKKGDLVTLDVVPLFGGGQKTFKQLEADLSYAQDFEISLQTLNHFIPIWMTNFKANLPLFVKDAKSYTDILPVTGDKKKGIVVANGPSLYETDLSPLKTFTGTIVCTNKPLKHLLENGIIPDYVCVLDAGPEVKDSFEHDIVKEHMNDLKGVFLPTMADHDVAKFVMDRIGGCKTFWHNPHFSDALAPNICETLTAITKIPSVEHGGNCLTGDTSILTYPRKPIPISDIQVGTELYVLKNQKLGVGKCTAKYDKGVKDVYWLRTRSRAIKATEEHMFPVARDGRILWLPLNRITTKDYVVILKELCDTGVPYVIPCNDLLSTRLTPCGVDALQPIKKLHNFKTLVKPESAGQRTHAYSVSNGRASARLRYLKDMFEKVGISLKPEHYRMAGWKDFDLPLETTNELMELLGMVVGDGYIRYSDKNQRCRGGVSVAVPIGDKARIRCTELIHTVFGIEPSTSAMSLTIHSRPIARMLIDLGFHQRSKNKTVPQWVYTLPHAQIVAFLTGIAQTDGHTVKNGFVSIEMASKKLVDGIIDLAIIAGVRVSGTVYSRKRNIHLNSHFYKDYQTYRIRLMLYPERYHGKSLNYVNWRVPKTGWKNLDDEQLTLDAVTGIEYAGKEHVYDITVENEHNFVANGIVAHNCGTFAYLMAIRPIMCNPIGIIGFDLSYRPKKTWALEETVKYRFFYIPEKDHYYAMTPVFEYYVSRLIDLFNKSSAKANVLTVNLTPVGPLNAIIGMKSQTLEQYTVYTRLRLPTTHPRPQLSGLP